MSTQFPEIRVVVYSKNESIDNFYSIEMRICLKQTFSKLSIMGKFKVFGKNGVLEDTFLSTRPRKSSLWSWPRKCPVFDRKQHYFLIC